MLSSSDKKQLVDALCMTAEAIGSTISPSVALMMADDLANYDLPILGVALRACRREVRGRLTVADIIARAQANDGRPEGDEAWSLAIVARDESVTTVLTDEIQGALWAAMPLLDIGDKVAARKAFLDVYERLVRTAREHGTPAEWHVSLGQNKQGRAEAIENAARLGRITSRKASMYLAQIGHDDQPITPDGAAIAGLITGKPIPLNAKEKTRENLRKLRESLQGNPVDIAAEKEFERQERTKLNARTDQALGIGDGILPEKNVDE